MVDPNHKGQHYSQIKVTLEDKDIEKKEEINTRNNNTANNRIMPDSTSSVHSRNSKNKRPKDTSFHQQKMPAVQPIMSPRTVIPTLLILGLIFIPLGILQIIISENTQEFVFDYTDCINKATDAFQDSGLKFLWKKEINESKCIIKFTLEKELKGPVFMFYRLSNFYQNNRLYTKSISYEQLSGEAFFGENLSQDCYPFTYPFPGNDKIVYYPCGLVANSYFNDTISGLRNINNLFYSFPAKDISWKSDSIFIKQSAYDLNQVRAPNSWKNRPDVDESGRYIKEIPNLSLDERFLNWIRVSALPTFRKLYGRHNGPIPAGDYEIEITDNYNVNINNGRKAVVISESSFLGGKSNFLGIAYVVVGSILLILGIAFLIKQFVSPRVMGDVTYLTWFQTIDS